MSLRCGCPDQADDIVFGPKHQCNLPAEIDRLEPPSAVYDPPVQRWETTLSDEGGDLG